MDEISVLNDAKKTVRSSKERMTMQTKIRIIKQGAGLTSNSPAAIEIEKTVEQRDREMANTVKSWVAEWQERNNALKRAAALLVRSVEHAQRSSMQPFAALNS